MRVSRQPPCRCGRLLSAAQPPRRRQPLNGLISSTHACLQVKTLDEYEAERARKA